MILPKKINMHNYMGRECYFDHDYYREYLHEKEKQDNDPDWGLIRVTPVKWKKYERKLTKGWVTGFGYCYNGQVKTAIEASGDGSTWFTSMKRINYVRVRMTPTGKEFKVPIENICFTAHKKKK